MKTITISSNGPQKDVMSRQVGSMIGVASILILAFAGPAIGQQKSQSTNRWCPVNPEKIAKPEFQLIHENDPVHFCCEDCQKEFNLRPEAYEKNLQWLTHRSQQSTIQIEDNKHHQDRGDSTLSSAASFMSEHASLMMMLALSLSIFLLADLIKRRRESKLSEDLKLEKKAAHIIAKPYFLLLMMQFSVITHLIFFSDEYQNNTNTIIYPYDDTADMVWHIVERQRDVYREFTSGQEIAIGKRLNANYEVHKRDVSNKSQPYKSDKIGFMLAEITNELGETIQAGSNITGQKLFLNWKFSSTSGPQTQLGDEQLKELVLLNLSFSDHIKSQAEIGNEFSVAFSEDQQVYHGRYPLGEFNRENAEFSKQEGTVFVAHPKGNQRGLACIDSAILAIPYRISIKKGVVQESSLLWIATTKSESRTYQLIRNNEHR